MFSGEGVGMVNAVVAGGAKGGVVGRTEDGCFVFVTDVAVDLHFNFTTVTHAETHLYKWIWLDKIT